MKGEGRGGKGKNKERPTHSRMNETLHTPIALLSTIHSIVLVKCHTVLDTKLIVVTVSGYTILGKGYRRTSFSLTTSKEQYCLYSIHTSQGTLSLSPLIRER